MVLNGRVKGRRLKSQVFQSKQYDGFSTRACDEVLGRFLTPAPFGILSLAEPSEPWRMHDHRSLLQLQQHLCMDARTKHFDL